MKKAIRQFLDKVSQYNRLVDDYKRAKDVSPDHGLAYVSWGLELAQEGRLEDALEKFRQAADITPNRPEPFLNWGVALAKMNRLDEALLKFQAAIERDPKMASAYTLWGAVLMDFGKHDEAKIQYEKAISLAPQSGDPYANWGISLARQGLYHEAIQKFKQSLAIQSYQPQVYFMWGAVLAELQDYDSAIEKFKLTLRFLPKHAEAYYFWGVVLNQLGRYEEALEKSKKALQLELEKPEAYLSQGDIFANLNRLDFAISNYRHATMLKPDFADAYLGWGVALCRQQQYEEGYAKLAKCQELQPGNVDVHRHWGEALLEQERYAEAIEHLRAAMALDEEHVETLLNLAMALMKTCQTDEAIALLFEVEKRERWNPQAQYLLGTHFLNMGDLEASATHLEKALEEKPDFEDAAVNLALVLCERGDTLEAVRRMRPIIRRLPDSARINFYYGTILYRHGDHKDAIAKYQKAILLQPQYVEARIGLAEVYLCLDELAEVDALLSALLTELSGPSCIPALFLLGVCRIRQADQAPTEALKRHLDEEALACFEKVLGFDPFHVDSLANQALMQGRLHSVAAMNQAFEALLSRSSEALKALLLYYWSKSLEQVGEPEAALLKLQEACHENPLIAEQIQAQSI